MDDAHSTYNGACESQAEHDPDVEVSRPGPGDRYGVGPELAPFLDAVDEALRQSLLDYADRMPPTLIGIGKMALSAPGKVMYHTLLVRRDDEPEEIVPTPKWPLYAILSYRAGAGPERRDLWREAVPAAVAVELAMAAADLLDEITDEDPSPIVAKYGGGQALNTANLMLVMAQQTLVKHAQESGDGRALAALGALQDMLVDAAVGQHLDMMYDKMGADEVDLEMSALVTELKAGTLIGGACRMGALVSGADERVVDLLWRFGKEMGGIAQVINDIQDVLPYEEGESIGLQRKTDIKLRKRTLPIVFALRDDSPEPNALQRAFIQGASEPVDEEELRRAIVEAGGVQFAQLVMEVHRQNALQVMEELEALRPGARKILSYLLPPDEGQGTEGEGPVTNNEGHQENEEAGQ